MHGLGALKNGCAFFVAPQSPLCRAVSKRRKPINEELTYKLTGGYAVADEDLI
jgi:hypothetical protein